MSPSLETLVAAFEYSLVLAGLGFLFWLFFRPAGRAARAQPPVLRRWDLELTDVLFLAWLVLALGIVGQLLLRATVGSSLHRLPDGPMLELVLYGSMFHFAVLVTWAGTNWYFVRRRALAPPPLEPAPPLRAAPVRAIPAALLTLVVAMPLLSVAGLLWEPLLKAVGLPTEHQELVDLFANAQSPWSLAPMAALALVVAPVSEEMVFRGGIFRFLLGRAPRWVAYTASAGLFALAHTNWVSFLPLFLLGLLFAAAYERTGRLAVPMLAHALFNLNSLLLVLCGIGN